MAGPALNRLSLISGAALAAALTCWIVLAGAHSLNQDEGYYSRAALHVLSDDPWLSTSDLDKPPLAIWLQAPGIALLGRNELGARLLGLTSCLMLLLLAGRIARRLAEEAGLDGPAARAACLWLLAASPYLLELGPLAMTDAPAAVFALLAIDAALSRRPAAIGAWVGLSWGVRQLGLLSVLIPALLLLLERLSRAERGPALHRALKSDALRFLAGFCLPVAPLLLWSGLAAREPFMWIFGEFLTKRGMSAPTGEPLLKLLHWLDVAGGFAPTAALSLLGMVGLLVLPAAFRGPAQRPLRRRLPALLLTCVGFLALFTLWGFPRYPRYLFPLLPPCIWGLSLVWAALLTRLRPAWRKACSMLLGLACLAGMALETSLLAQPLARDDLPPLARRIVEECDERCALLSRDLNRQILFYMFDEQLKLGQWHDQPAERIPAMLEQYETRRVLLLLQREDDELERPELFSEYVGPLRLLELETNGPRDQIRLYRVQPRRRPLRTPLGLAWIEDGQVHQLSSAGLIAAVQTGMAARTDAAGLSVSVAPNLAASDERIIMLSSLSVRAEALELDGMRYSDLRLDYLDAGVLAEPLIGYGSLRIADPGRATGSLLVRHADLAAEVGRHNPDFRRITVASAGPELTIAAELSLWGRNHALQVSGRPEVREGRMHYCLSSVSAAGIVAPQWLLRRVERRINPVLDSRLPRLGVGIVAAEVVADGVLLKLGPSK